MSRVPIFNMSLILTLLMAFFPATTISQTYDLNNLPEVIPDPSASDWVVDRFAGNTTTGLKFYQGPATEVGGLTYGTEAIIERSDGAIYITDGKVGLLERLPDGSLWLLMGATGLVEGPMEQCQFGRPIWNIHDASLYLTGPNCIRRVVTHPDSSQWVEVVAGIPTISGSADGPAKNATIGGFSGVVCDSTGKIYWSEGYSIRCFRNDSVITLPPSSVHGQCAIGKGRTNNVLYIYYYSDIWSLDLTTFQETRIFGVQTGSTYDTLKGRNQDGPALTHASVNSNIVPGAYDTYHDALWVGGPDESRFRWLKMGPGSDGWVRSVIGLQGTSGWDRNGFSIPGSTVKMVWAGVTATDSKGGIFLRGAGDPTGVWRAYNKTEVK